MLNMEKTQETKYHTGRGIGPVVVIPEDEVGRLSVNYRKAGFNFM